MHLMLKVVRIMHLKVKVVITTLTLVRMKSESSCSPPRPPPKKKHSGVRHIVIFRVRVSSCGNCVLWSVGRHIKTPRKVRYVPVVRSTSA